jgi:hypothetical protein
MSLLSNVKELELPSHGVQYKDFIEQEGNYVISPSGLRNFVSNRAEWYKNTVLKERTFEGNEKSCIGSLLHQYAEDYYNGELTNDNKLLDWKIKQISKDYPEAVIEFERVYPYFREIYLDTATKPDEQEKYMEYNLTDNIKLAGSCDFVTIENGKHIIGDYKSTSKTFKDMEQYFLQLSVYSLLYELTTGIKIDCIRCVGIILLKEPKITILESKPDVEIVKKMLENIVYSIQLVKDNPELKELIFFENYYDMFSKEKLNKEEVSFKELDKTSIKRTQLKNSIFG